MIMLVPFAAASALLLIIWGVSLRFKNIGFVDVAWSFSFTVLAWVYFFTERGYFQRKLTMAILVTLWSLRLTWHLLKRVLKDPYEEDARYANVRAHWSKRGGRAGWNSFWLFQFQAALAVVLSWPFFLIARDPAKKIAVIEMVGAAWWAVSLAGEAAADRELEVFKRGPANRGRVCQKGLWRYSRHPNYFFEWMVWCAYFLMAVGSPGGWIALVSPLLMLFLLLKVTGVPWAEAQSLRSRGEKYRSYQRRTSLFVPWFPKDPD